MVRHQPCSFGVYEVELHCHYNMRADNITIYTKMEVEIVEFFCLLLYQKEKQMS